MRRPLYEKCGCDEKEDKKAKKGKEKEKEKEDDDDEDDEKDESLADRVYSFLAEAGYDPNKVYNPEGLQHKRASKGQPRETKFDRYVFNVSKVRAHIASKTKKHEDILGAAYEFLEAASPGSGTISRRLSTKLQFPNKRSDRSVLDRRGTPDRTGGPASVRIQRLK